MKAVALLLLVTGLAAAEGQPRIINGRVTQNPAVVAVMLRDGGGLFFTCTGTLISPTRILTAAHCLCGDNARSCRTEGIEVYRPEPNRFGTRRQVVRVRTNRRYRFAKRWDVATLDVDVPFSDAQTVQLAKTAPPHATGGWIEGFGEYDYDRKWDGQLRVGVVTTSACQGVPERNHVCWTTTKGENDTCYGDSGGPLFTFENGSMVQSGITSGGSTPCWGVSYDTSVARYRRWILQP